MRDDHQGDTPDTDTSGRRSAAAAFLRSEAAGGVVLIMAAAAAMLVANSGWNGRYLAALHRQAGPLTVHGWINDAAMALFFLLVGLEIKRELTDGHLARRGSRTLPVLAAVAGMVVPALIFLATTGGDRELAPGWAIPMATDIAFAMAMMAMLGRRVPAGLKLFLATVAIVDDLGAVAVIAIGYTRHLDGGALAGGLAVLTVMSLLNRAGATRLRVYLPLALLLWIATWRSGIHPTIAGVLTAAVIPLRHPHSGRSSPLHRLEHGLQPWVAFLVVPVFGFANAGVSLGDGGLGAVAAPLPLGIAAGLFLGKQAGVLGAVWGAARLGIAAPPRGANWAQVYGTALLCGIGFTMSLFIGGLAFAGPAETQAVKLGVLAGSTLSAVAGLAVLRLASRR